MVRHQPAANLGTVAARDASTALRVARELDEDGDAEAARRCVEYAISRARGASAGEPLRFSEGDVDGPEPPAALVAAVALTTLGNLARQQDELDGARQAYEESLAMWPGNAMACYWLADLELHHGCFDRAYQLFHLVADLPPCRANSYDWHIELVEKPRTEAVANTSYTLCLLMHLLGRYDDAVPVLRRLGVGFRLSPAVWDAVTAQGVPTVLPTLRDASAAPRVARYSDVVPSALLRQLKAAFGGRSPFWTETGYLSRGYFSFWYDTSQPPSNAVEALAVRMLPLTGCADRVVGCEWWVHSKAASRSLGNQHGHQLHFDTEEGVLYAAREVVHPAVSSVLYLSGAAAAGPTVVLNQRYSEQAPADLAHISHPQDGHVLLFPGDRLHGVCPTAAAVDHARTPGRRHGRPAPLCGSARLPRRTTLMIGFWTRNVAPEVLPP